LTRQHAVVAAVALLATSAGADASTATGSFTAQAVINSACNVSATTLRVGLREPNRAAVERSYRVFVREVPPTAVPESGLRFAVRIGVPVFAVPVASTVAAAQLAWRWLPDLHGCARVQLLNSAARRQRVIAAEMLSGSGEVLSTLGAAGLGRAASMISRGYACTWRKTTRCCGSMPILPCSRSR
jgi:P pilus assembly chaperone PapD